MDGAAQCVELAMTEGGIKNVHCICLAFFPASIVLAGKKFPAPPLLLDDAIETRAARMYKVTAPIREAGVSNR